MESFVIKRTFPPHCGHLSLTVVHRIDTSIGSTKLIVRVVRYITSGFFQRPVRLLARQARPTIAFVPQPLMLGTLFWAWELANIDSSN